VLNARLWQQLFQCLEQHGRDDRAFGMTDENHPLDLRIEQRVDQRAEIACGGFGDGPAFGDHRLQQIKSETFGRAVEDSEWSTKHAAQGRGMHAR
jgi:hypothetical protein